MTFKSTIFAAVVSIAFVPAAQAQGTAHSNGTTGSSELVSVSDLNLNSDDGVEILDSRIRDAVEKVCGGRSQSNLIFGQPVRQCQRETIALVQPARDQVIAAARSNKTTRMAAASIEIRRES